MNNIVGTCSLCGGNVTCPDIYLSVIPPVPTCASCGATKRSEKPVIDMSPPPRTKKWTWLSDNIYSCPPKQPPTKITDIEIKKPSQ